MQGEPTYPGNKSTFDGINTPEGTVEGNAICANTKFVAVSYFFLSFFTDAMESWRWWISCCARSSVVWKD